MSEAQQQKRKQVKVPRLEIVAELYKRGNSVRKIRTEVMTRLELSSYSTATVQNDIKTLLVEWRESRINDMDLALQLELERIDDTVKELWEQWEKSKRDYTKTSNRRRGAPVCDVKTGATSMKTIQKEEIETEVIMQGDVSYISEIRHQLAERRKLLGLYAPEKKSISSDVSFAAFLIESGVLDEDE